MHLNLSSLVNAPSAIIESFFHVLPRRSVKQDQTGDIFSKWLSNARHLLRDKPDTQSLMSRAKCQVHQLIRPLFDVSGGGAIIENDQGICSFKHETHYSQPVIDMMLIGSQDKEISVFLGKTSISLVECECWTEMNHVIEFPSEFTGQKINQVLCLT